MLVSILEGLHIDIDYEVIQPESEYSQHAARLIDAIKVKSDIESYSMPVIVYEGPSESLADIFEKILAREHAVGGKTQIIIVRLTRTTIGQRIVNLWE